MAKRKQQGPYKDLQTIVITGSTVDQTAVGELASVRMIGHGKKFGVFPTTQFFDFIFELTAEDKRILGQEVYGSVDAAQNAVDDDREFKGEFFREKYLLRKMAIALTEDSEGDRKNAVLDHAANLARLNDQQEWYLRLLGVDATRENFDPNKSRHFDPAIRMTEVKELIHIIDSLRLRGNNDVLRSQESALSPTGEEESRIQGILGLTDQDAKKLAQDFAENCDLKDEITDLQDSLDQILRIRSQPDPLSDVGLRKQSSIKNDKGAPVWPPRQKFMDRFKPNRWAEKARIITDFQRALFKGKAKKPVAEFIAEHSPWLKQAGFDEGKIADLTACLNASDKSFNQRHADRTASLADKLKRNYPHLTDERRDAILALRQNLPRISKGRREQRIDYNEINRKLRGTTSLPRDALLHVRSDRLEQLVQNLCAHRLQTLRDFNATKNDTRRELGLPHWPKINASPQPAVQQKKTPQDEIPSPDTHSDPENQTHDLEQGHRYQQRVNNSKPLWEQTGKVFSTFADALFRYGNTCRLGITDMPWALGLMFDRVTEVDFNPTGFYVPFFGVLRRHEDRPLVPMIRAFYWEKARQQAPSLTIPIPIPRPTYTNEAWTARAGYTLAGAYIAAAMHGLSGMAADVSGHSEQYDIPFSTAQIRACALPADQRSAGIDIAPVFYGEGTNARLMIPDAQTINADENLLGYRACVWLRGHLTTHFMNAGITDPMAADAMATNYLLSRFVIERNNPEMIGPTTFENTRDLIRMAETLNEPDRLMPPETVTAGWDAERVVQARAALQEMAWAHFYLPHTFRQTNLRPEIEDNIAFDTLDYTAQSRITNALDLEFSASLSWKEAKFGTDTSTDRSTAEGAFQFIDDTGLMALSLAAEQGGLIDQIVTNPLVRDDHRAILLQAQHFARNEIAITRTPQATYYQSANMAGYYALVHSPFVAYIMHRAHLQHERERYPSLQSVAALSVALGAYNAVHVYGRDNPASLTLGQQSRAALANCGQGVEFTTCAAFLEDNASRDFNQVGRWPIERRIAYEGGEESWRFFRLEEARATVH